MEQEIVQLDNNTEYKMLCQGNTAEVFLYDDTTILKLFRDNFPQQIIATEFDLAKRVSEAITFAPKALEMVEYKTRIGILYEKIDGKDLIAEMMKKPLKINSYSKMLASVHAAMHSATADLGVDIKSNLLTNINAAAELSAEQKEKIAAYLNALPNGNALCHFDFHPGNVMIKDNKFYVIDWMTASNGAAAADVARSYLLLRYGELLFASPLVKLIAHVAEKHIGKIYLRHYKKLTGITDADVKKWLLPIAAARLIEWITKSEKRKLLKFVNKELSKIK